MSGKASQRRSLASRALIEVGHSSSSAGIRETSPSAPEDLSVGPPDTERLAKSPYVAYIDLEFGLDALHRHGGVSRLIAQRLSGRFGYASIEATNGHIHFYVGSASDEDLALAGRFSDSVCDFMHIDRRCAKVSIRRIAAADRLPPDENSPVNPLRLV